MYTGWNPNSTATTTQGYYTIGTTSTAQQIGWNGGVVRVVSSPVRVLDPPLEDPLDWLRRRVDELRVDLAA